jgi:hypothetical protein
MSFCSNWFNTHIAYDDQDLAIFLLQKASNTELDGTPNVLDMFVMPHSLKKYLDSEKTTMKEKAQVIIIIIIMINCLFYYYFLSIV